MAVLWKCEVTPCPTFLKLQPPALYSDSEYSPRYNFVSKTVTGHNQNEEG